MITKVRLSAANLKVLSAFLEELPKPLAGADIFRMKGVPSGSLYPILDRFEKAGWLTSEWEQLDPSQEGRPRKRLYRLTGVGERCARDAIREVTPSREQWAWSF
jgi:PadR family transcriptional regulator, regulatory protein PadR